MQVHAERIEEMNLLGLFMKAALEERLSALERARPRDDIGIESGGMSVTLSFSPDGVIVRNGIMGKPRARLAGDLGSLAAIAQGKFIGPIARGKVRISGDPLALLPLARVFGGW
jgi:hypothetical protein